MPTNSKTNIIFTSCGILAIIGLLFFLSDVLAPVYFAVFFAYAFSPIVERFEYTKLGRLGISILVLLIFCTIGGLFIAILVPQIIGDLSHIVKKIPELEKRFSHFYDNELIALLGQYDYLIPYKSYNEFQTQLGGKIQEWLPKFAEIFSTGLKNILGSVLTILKSLATLLFIPFFMFFFLKDWKKGIEHIESLIPVHLKNEVNEISNETDKTLAKYFRGQMIIMIILSTIYSTGLSIIGLEASLTLGILSGVLFLIPYAGALFAFSICLIFALIQYSSMGQIVSMGFLFLFATQLEGWILTPKITGEGVGMTAWQTVLIIILMGSYFGVIGVALAIPTGAITVVLLNHFIPKYKKSKYFLSEKVIK